VGVMSAVVVRMSGDANWVSMAVAEVETMSTDKVFLDSLAFVVMMVEDGVISAKSALVDYGSNQSIYSARKALFIVQGQWAAGSIDPVVANDTLMLAWPTLPGEQAGMVGSVAAAPQVGHSLTKKGATDRKVRDAALKDGDHLRVSQLPPGDPGEDRLVDDLVQLPVGLRAAHVGAPVHAVRRRG